MVRLFLKFYGVLIATLIFSFVVQMQLMSYVWSEMSSGYDFRVRFQPTFHLVEEARIGAPRRCRIGADAQNAVCDERGAVRGIAGLYVADASLFPASSGVNPMVTIMALAKIVGESIGAAESR